MLQDNKSTKQTPNKKKSRKQVMNSKKYKADIEQMYERTN